MVENNIVTIVPDFADNFTEYDVELLIKDLSVVLSDLAVLSNAGFINDSGQNIPEVAFLLTKYNLRVIDESDEEYTSICLNIVVYYLILLLLLLASIKLDTYIKEKYINFSSDLVCDLKVFKKEILRRLHPYLNNRIANRGLSIIMNTFVGYDSEYELLSSLKKVNTLLSIQLAVNTNMYVKVPRYNCESVKTKDLDIKTFSATNEQKSLRIFLNSIEIAIKNIRSLTCLENDNFLEKISSSLDKLKLESIELECYKMYIFPKTAMSTSIKYPEVYKVDNLINDSDDLQREEHTKFLKTLFNLLNNLTDNNRNGLSVKLLKGIEYSVNKPSSRLCYGINESLKMNISINRMLYLCMHESTADLSMLSDFEVFKEELDIVQRSFITRSKPLKSEN